MIEWIKAITSLFGGDNNIEINNQNIKNGNNNTQIGTQNNYYNIQNQEKINIEERIYAYIKSCPLKNKIHPTTVNIAEHFNLTVEETKDILIKMKDINIKLADAQTSSMSDDCIWKVI